MPKISVIVPVYNTEKYLHRCIDSILAQTFTDFELLLIDDGSKDNSGTICDEYAAKDSRVRVFHKENGGVSSARNLGLDNARGEWICFCDSDDYVEFWWLETFIKNSINVELVVQGFSNKMSLKDENDFYYEGTVDELLRLLYERQLVGYTVLKMFKKEIINQYKIRFDRLIKFREDEEFVLKYLSNINNVRHINKGGYYYYVPDWRNKYSHIDPYYVTSSMYELVIKIYHNVPNNITKEYLKEYIFALFASFKRNSTNINYRVKVFKKNVGKQILYANEVSLMSRILIYFFPACMIAPIYRFKYRIAGKH